MALIGRMNKRYFCSKCGSYHNADSQLGIAHFRYFAGWQ